MSEARAITATLAQYRQFLIERQSLALSAGKQDQLQRYFTPETGHHSALALWRDYVMIRFDDEDFLRVIHQDDMSLTIGVIIAAPKPFYRVTSVAPFNRDIEAPADRFTDSYFKREDHFNRRGGLNALGTAFQRHVNYQIRSNRKLRKAEERAQRDRHRHSVNLRKLLED